MKNTRKVLSMLLVIAMVIAMSVNALALEDGYIYLTNHTDTNYAYTVSSSDNSIIDLKVVPANDKYARSAFTYEEAADIDWGYEELSDEDYIMIAGLDPVEIDGGYAAYAQVYVFEGAEVGPSSFYAINSYGNKMNFTVVVDGTDSAKTGISCVYIDQPDATTNTELLTVRNMTVAGNEHYGLTQYPSALDGVLKTWYDTFNGTGNRMTDKEIGTDWEADVVKSMTFQVGNQTITRTNYTTENYEYFGWQYRVYRNGDLQPMSEMVGAGEFKLQNGDVVMWKFGQYGVVSFPGTYTLPAA